MDEQETVSNPKRIAQSILDDRAYKVNSGKLSPRELTEINRVTWAKLESVGNGQMQPVLVRRHDGHVLCAWLQDKLSSSYRLLVWMGGWKLIRVKRSAEIRPVPENLRSVFDHCCVMQDDFHSNLDELRRAMP